MVFSCGIARCYHCVTERITAFSRYKLNSPFKSKMRIGWESYPRDYFNTLYGSCRKGWFSFLTNLVKNEGLEVKIKCSF